MKAGYLKTALDLVREGGKIARKYLGKSGITFKEDKSVLTKADREISGLARRHLAPYLKSPRHILLDEEDFKVRGYSNSKEVAQAPYLWSVDPIDGTRLYANQIPLYGISIGLIKNKTPWLGAVYFPSLGELYYCDGRQAYFVQNAFTANETKRRIKPSGQEIDSRSIFLCDDEFLRHYNWDYSDAQLMISSCAVVDLCWPAVNRACGAVFCSHLWDLAGSWPIFRAAGLELRAIKTGKVLKQLDVKAFQSNEKPWRANGFYILSTAKNFKALKQKITLRRKN